MDRIDYFFVNKTGQSEHLSRSDAGERKSMGAYIQGRRVRVQQKHSPELETYDRSQTPSTHGDHSIKTYMKRIDIQDLSEQAQSDSQQHVHNRVSFINAQTASVSRCQIELIWTFDASNSAPNLVQSACTLLHSDMYHLLHYFVRIYEPSIRHIETIMLSKHSSARRVELSMMCLHDILCSQMETDALLAAMAARIQDIECADQRGRSLVYSNRAMSAISKAIAPPVDKAPRVFRAIFFLMVAAWHHQDTTAFKMHLTGLKAILDSIGGLDAVNVAIKTELITFDGFISAVQYERPCFASKHLNICGEDRIWLADQMLSSEVHSTLGRQLADGEHRHLYGLGLYDLILTLVKYIRVVEWQSALTNPCPRLANLVSRKLNITRHQLLELEGIGVRACIVRMAILIWMVMVLTSEGTSRSVQLMVRRLQDLLLERQRDQWHGHEPLYFWILCVGIMAAEVGSSTHTYLISEIKQTLADTRKTGFESQEDLVRFLRAFLYLHCVQTELMQKLARYVVV